MLRDPLEDQQMELVPESDIEPEPEPEPEPEAEEEAEQVEAEEEQVEEQDSGAPPAVAEGTPPSSPEHATLMEMGFSDNASRRALAATGSLEAALEWCFAHSEDADFNDPFVEAPPPSSSSGLGQRVRCAS